MNSLRIEIECPAFKSKTLLTRRGCVALQKSERRYKCLRCIYTREIVVNPNINKTMAD